MWTLFVGAPPALRARHGVRAPSTGPRMSKGFDARRERRERRERRGATPGQQRRQSASTKYDEMAAAGLPEYTIWLRLKRGGVLAGDEEGGSDGVMPWLPVGCIAVPRSGRLADALRAAEQDLWQGAERLYPNIGREDRANVEFGYQLRQFPDEEIRVVGEEDGDGDGFGGWLRSFWRGVQNPLRG